MRTRTKITCTMGPAVSSYEKIVQLIDAGMDVARLNFSHGTQDEHSQVIKNLKRARKEKKVPLAIMLDTKGPEIRLGKIEGESLEMRAGMKIKLVPEPVLGNAKELQLTPAVVFKNLEVGAPILFADGYILSKVIECSSQGVVVEIQNSGILRSNNNAHVPQGKLDIPAVTEQDIKDIAFGCKQDVDIIAASFIRSADHILEIRKLLMEYGKPEIIVIAKIESSEGVKNFDSILAVADGIMVARGDLGVELPLREVPKLQKMMIRKCYEVSKPVITATQMLESMIKNPRPTRAEVSDVANAIYDSTSSVMLSGETAIGQYPIETVKIMKSIMEETEKDFDYRSFFDKETRTDYNDISSSVALAAVKTAYSADAKAIFAFTSSGFTARLISKFRPAMPILALTDNEKTYHQMALNWGVIPVDPQASKNVQEAITATSSFAIKQSIIQSGDLVVVTAGSPFGISGTTNMMMVESVF